MVRSVDPRRPGGRGGAFRSHFGVANLAAHCRGPGHRGQREQRQDEDDAGVETRRTSDAAPLLPLWALPIVEAALEIGGQTTPDFEDER